MINAAIESLQEYHMDVLFVIYSQNQFNQEDQDQDECYQVKLNN